MEGKRGQNCDCEYIIIRNISCQTTRNNKVLHCIAYQCTYQLLYCIQMDKDCYKEQLL